MNKSIIAGIVGIVVIAGVVMLVGKKEPATPVVEETQQPTPSTPTPTPTPTPSPSGPTTQEFTVNASNFAFAPNMIKVKKGDTVKITVKDGNGFHDLKIDEFGVATKKMNTGEQDTITFVADKSGSFEYYCSVGTHRAMGMKGTLIVE